MCGRFSLGQSRSHIIQAVARAYPEVQLREWFNEDQFHPRYNIAPRSQSPVIRRANAHVHGSGNAESSQSNDELVLHTMKWGLVPYWSKYEDKTLSTINARSENLVEGGGMWGSIKGRKRCLIPCEGYYEWLKKGKDRLPHFTKHKDGKIMLLAGLYDCVTLEGEAQPLWTFTIVTTDANKDFTWLHERQPVILSAQADIEVWLDTSSQTWTKELTAIVRSSNHSKSTLECYPVPKEVGKVGTESATFILPISQRKDGIEAMFSKQNVGTSSPKKNNTHLESSGDKSQRSSNPTKTELKRKNVPDIYSDEANEEPNRKVKKVSEQTSTTTSKSNSSEKSPELNKKDAESDNAETTALASHRTQPQEKATKPKSPKKSPAKAKNSSRSSDPKISQFFSKA